MICNAYADEKCSIIDKSECEYGKVALCGAAFSVCVIFVNYFAIFYVEKNNYIIIIHIWFILFIYEFCMENTKFVLDYFPPAWFPKRSKRDTWTCANYTLKAVIEAKTWEIKKLKDYADWWWSYISNFMTPWSLTSVLKRYKIQYKVLKCRFVEKTERLRLLKEEILDGPVILAIANGLTKNKYFSWEKALTHWHYISLWWFDDEEKCFYVYDSSCVREVDPELKVWTVKVPYKYVLKSWSVGYYKIYSNFGIAVKY